MLSPNSLADRATDTAVVHPEGEVIGVVRNASYSSLGTSPEPATFLPYHRFPLGATFVVRTTLPPASLERAIRREVAAVDPDVPTYELGTMTAAVAESVSQLRFYTVLLGAFATIGKLTPSSWAMTGLQNILIRGLGLESVWISAGILLAYALFFFVIAVWRFRKMEA